MRNLLKGRTCQGKAHELKAMPETYWNILRGAL